MQDYNYMFTNTFEVLVEMACCKFPLQRELPKYWNDHKNSLINYIKLAHMGVKGSIRFVVRKFIYLHQLGGLCLSCFHVYLSCLYLF